MQDWMFEIGADPFAPTMTPDPWAPQPTGWAEPAPAFDPVVDWMDPLFVPPADDEEDPPYELEDVVVVRNPNQNGGGPPPPPPPPPWTPPPPPPPPPVDPTGPTGGDPGPSDPVAKDTPCVATVFESGADRAAVNNAALKGAGLIASQNDEEWEYSVIVYSFNGNIETTFPHTDHLPDWVNLIGNIHRVPSGAIILGIVHNQPDQAQANDAVPSQRDWISYFHLADQVATLQRNITVDRNMLMYIDTNEQNGKVRVYDRTDANTQMQSCSIE